ncbi:MAG TPA: acyltransferase [Capsulimonadaceae bacterium]|nr:acyltransferase [Capsulimonadaceae bacterium]
MSTNDPISVAKPLPPKQVAESIAKAKGRPAGDSFSARISRAIRGDFEAYHPRLALASILLFFLPRGSFSRLRTAIYRACGVRIGRGTILFGSLDLSGPGAIWKRLKIGTDCQINSPLFLDLNSEITIGNGVAIGHHVVLVTANHEIGPAEHRCGALDCVPIRIEDGCWIGARTTILPGVTIGRGSVVSVGSVVSADVPPNRVVGGVPARPVKQLEE